MITSAAMITASAISHRNARPPGRWWLSSEEGGDGWVVIAPSREAANGETRAAHGRIISHTAHAFAFVVEQVELAVILGSR